MLLLPDANVLINALRKNAEAHEPCRRWLLEAARAGDEIGLCELVEVAMLRICTLPRMSLVPMPLVLGFWQDDLWSYPNTRRIVATPSHNLLFQRLVMTHDLVGNDVNNAWLAALAITQGATLVSLDHGFARFPGLARLNPSA